MSAVTDARVEEIRAALNQFAADGVTRDRTDSWACRQPEVAHTRGFLPPGSPEVELTDGTVIAWSRDIRRWEVALPERRHAADDYVVLADLLALRQRGLPAWHRIHTADHLVQLRMADPNHIALWLKEMGSKADLVLEPFADEGVDFHHADVCDWHAGWTVYFACRVGRSGTGVLDEVPVHVPPQEGSWGDWP